MATKKKASSTKPPKKKPSFAGTVCRICGAKWGPERKGFVRHHLAYPSPTQKEVTVVLCHACHSRAHGQGRLYSHPFKKDFPKDLEPYIFALAVVEMYDQELILPAILEAVRDERLTMMANMPSGTVH